MKKSILLILICVGLVLTGCSTTVKRMDADEVIDISGKWNDTDSRLVSEEMIRDVMNRPWIKKHNLKHGGALPVVIVGTVRNRSHEHISVQTFVKDLERALINSGEVEFVAGSNERGDLREERKDQAAHSSEDTAKAEHQETGADFMLQGAINTILDKEKRKSVMFYQVDLELIEIETHKKVWIGEKKIKKYIKTPLIKP